MSNIARVLPVDIYGIFIASIPFIGAGIGIGVALAAIYYFFAKIINDGQMLARAKQSLNNVMETIVVLGTFLALASLTSTAISIMFGFPTIVSDAHIIMAQLSLEKYVGVAENIYITAYIYEAFMSILFAFNTPLYTISSTSLIVQPLAGLHMILSYQSTLMNLAVMNFLGVILRYYLIRTIPFLIAFLLPLGALFRAMNFTKSLGSSILALTLTLYFVFPLSVVFTDNLFFRIYYTGDSIAIPNLEVPTALGGNKISQDAAEQYYNLINDPQVRNSLIQSGVVKTPEEASLTSTLWTNIKDRIAKIAEGSLSYLIGGTVISTTKSFVPPTSGKLVVATKVASSLSTLALFIAFNPLDVARGLFSLLTVEFFVIGKFLVLLLLSLFFEVMISITAYKELAQALGGEALLFGLNKVM